MAGIDLPSTPADELEVVAASSESRLNAPLRSALVYAIGATLPRAVTFLLLPVYTRVLSPAEYGTLALLAAVSAAAGIVLTLGFDFAVFRTYFELANDADRQERFIHSAWRFVLVSSLTLTCVCGGVFWIVGAHLQRADGLDVLLALVASALGTSAMALPLAVLRAEQRLKPFLVVSSVATAGNAVLTVLAVVVLHGGVRGWLIAALLANTCTFLTTAALLPWRRRITFDMESVRRCLGLGLPLVPHFLAHWALLLADRVLLAALVSASALGVYSLASNLALPIMILVQSLNQGFMPTYARAGTGEITRERLSETVTLHAAIVALICLGGGLLAPPLADIIAPASYGRAGSLVAWIVLGYGFLGLYYIPMNGTALGAGKTRFVAVATLISAVTNLGIIVGFVPTYGLTPAAIASAAAYAVLLAAVFVYARSPKNPVQYRWRSLGFVFASTVAVYTAATLTTSNAGVTSLFLRTAWLFVALIPLLAVNPAARHRVTSALRAAARRVAAVF